MLIFIFIFILQTVWSIAVPFMWLEACGRSVMFKNKGTMDSHTAVSDLAGPSGMQLTQIAWDEIGDVVEPQQYTKQVVNETPPVGYERKERHAKAEGVQLVPHTLQ